MLPSLIYRTCTDVNGCPLATAVMYSIQQKTLQNPQLRDRFRMGSLSFDPVFDTPEVISRYGSGFVDQGGWDFLTTDSLERLSPILDGYNQTVIRDLDADGKALPSFSHILRVFLVDPDRRIRNILQCFVSVSGFDCQRRQGGIAGI